MAFTQAELQTLKDEITNDPLGFGYAALPNDSDVADLLNSLTTGRTIPSIAIISTHQVYDLFDSTDYVNAMNDTKKQQLLAHLLSMGTVIAGSNNVRDALIEVFGVGSTTIANLTPLRTQTASRAQELGLPFVTPSDVANAKRLP